MYLYVKCINCAFSTIILLNFGTVSTVWYLIGLQDEFEDTKGVIRIRKLKKDRQHNAPKTRTKVKQ